MPPDDPLVETWQIHDRIHIYMLNAIDEESLGDVLNGKGRSVREQFAHIHNVRLLWLKSAAPELLEGLEKIDVKGPVSKQEVAAALAASGAAIEKLIVKAQSAGGRVKAFKPHVTAFVGYLIAHESHHRGQIGWTLKHSGHPLDAKTAFGLWEWGTR
jgi:uncharacterized damage-inducible protein DinB